MRRSIKVVIVSVLLLLLSGCGVGEMIDGAISMKDTVSELLTASNEENIQSIQDNVTTLTQQWSSIEGLVKTVNPDLHDQIAGSMERIEEITASANFDPMELQLQIRLLSTALEELIQL